MPILNRTRIEELVNQGTLILNPLRNSESALVVEAASYDLRAGIVLWKERTSNQLRVENFEDGKDHQAMVTLQPGQMVFVITHEELKLPGSVSGTVYSRNRLQKENILALNAGHVDPCYEGPIIIRLINLGAQPWALRLGDAVFTVVFHTVEPTPDSGSPDRRTKDETLEAAARTATNAFSNPFHDLYKDEITRQLNDHYSRAENNLRIALSKDFFRRDELRIFVFEVAAIILAGIFLLTRIPWDKVWWLVKFILNL
jgi:deoxycytidine triphosphate deaminase